MLDAFNDTNQLPTSNN